LALLQDHRVDVDSIGQIIHNEGLDHIARLDIKTGLGNTNLVKTSFGGINSHLNAVS